MFIEDDSQVSRAKFGVVGERGERASWHGGARPQILSSPSASRRVCEVQRGVGMTCLKWALGLGTGLLCPPQALSNCGPQCTWEESAHLWGHRSCTERLRGAGRIRIRSYTEIEQFLSAQELHFSEERNRASFTSKQKKKIKISPNCAWCARIKIRWLTYWGAGMGGLGVRGGGGREGERDAVVFRLGAGGKPLKGDIWTATGQWEGTSHINILRRAI